MDVNNGVKGPYNGFWKLYKDYLESHDMEAYNKGAEALCGEYANKFCHNLAIVWASEIEKEKKRYENN